MINSDIINLVLQSILGQKAPLGRDPMTSNRAFVCLGSQVGLTPDGKIGEFTEPESSTGYKRYLIGAYD